MAETIITPRRNLPWAELGQAVAQPFAQQQAQQQSIYTSLMPLLFKAKLEQQSKLDELALRMSYGAKIRKELMDGGNGPDGEYMMELDEWGLPKSYKQKSPKEKLADIEAQKDLEYYRGGKQPPSGNIPPSIQREIDKAQEIESAKPYSDITANVIVTSEDLIPKIDKLIAMVEKPGNIFGVPLLGGKFGGLGTGAFTGQSRIGAAGKVGPWQAFKMGLTTGKGREAATLLKDIRELAFGKGGKTLSENEAAIALSSIDPSYKTSEDEWISGLKSAKRQLQRKMELVSKKPMLKTNGQRMRDAQGNEAIVYPDGSYEEIK